MGSNPIHATKQIQKRNQFLIKKKQYHENIPRTILINNLIKNRKKMKTSIKTTLDSKTYKVLRLKGELYCSFCKPHKGCNLNNKKIYSGRKRISWKVVYKDKKQWMKFRHSNRDIYY